MLQGKVNLNGRILEPDRAGVSAFDHGFLYGDSVFETLRAFSGKCFRWKEHLARLHRSAQAQRLALPVSDADLASRVAETCQEAGEKDAAVRIVVTRGVGALDPDPRHCEHPTTLIYVRARPAPPEGSSTRGVTLHVARSVVASLGAHHKTGNYLPNVMALHEARERGAYEAIVLNPMGHVAELATSNVFMVRRGEVLTPSAGEGLLEGITRSVVIEACAAMKIPCREQPLLIDDLGEADEVFLCSTLKGVLPVRAIDTAPIGGGAGAGPVTKRIQILHREAIHEDVGAWPPEDS
jgi:branched-chain amino acid aminotransferase